MCPFKTSAIPLGGGLGVKKWSKITDINMLKVPTRGRGQETRKNLCLKWMPPIRVMEISISILSSRKFPVFNLWKLCLISILKRSGEGWISPPWLWKPAICVVLAQVRIVKNPYNCVCSYVFKTTSKGAWRSQMPLGQQVGLKCS